MVYLISSLRNPEVPKLANRMRAAGLEVFEDWAASHPDGDDHWRDYEKGRGHTFKEALKGYAAQNIFNFDKTHLMRADAVVLVLPAGRSGHLELGWSLGRGVPGYILLAGEPERFDVMYAFATEVFDREQGLIDRLLLNKIDTEELARRRRVRTNGPNVGNINRSLETTDNGV